MTQGVRRARVPAASNYHSALNSVIKRAAGVTILLLREAATPPRSVASVVYGLT
jgi:hypothetical protein